MIFISEIKYVWITDETVEQKSQILLTICQFAMSCHKKVLKSNLSFTKS